MLGSWFSWSERAALLAAERGPVLFKSLFWGWVVVGAPFVWNALLYCSWAMR